MRKLFVISIFHSGHSICLNSNGLRLLLNRLRALIPPDSSNIIVRRCICCPHSSAVSSVLISDNITPLYSPTTVTLIPSAHKAVLVDPLFTRKQADSLADWIEDLYPDKRATYVSVNHGHGDYFFSLFTLLKRFPNATAIATKGTLAHREEQISPGNQDF